MEDYKIGDKVKYISNGELIKDFIRSIVIDGNNKRYETYYGYKYLSDFIKE